MLTLLKAFWFFVNNLLRFFFFRRWQKTQNVASKLVTMTGFEIKFKMAKNNSVTMNHEEDKQVHLARWKKMLLGWYVHDLCSM